MATASCSAVRILALVSALSVGPAVTAALADNQPIMQAALADLQAARAKLQSAEHDKGGYREKAIQAVDTAIQRVEAGIAWANAHPH
jgi:hypothetical protein